MRSFRILEGDALAVLRTLPSESAHMCCTSPPYWGGVRDYGMDGQLGFEREPELYVEKLTSVFDEVRRVLRSDGMLFLNLGDVYAASGKGGGGSLKRRKSWSTVVDRKGFRMPPSGYKMKDLTLTPFQVADSLRISGWYLRSTVIWEKPSACEPARLDRPCVSHEYVFIFARSEKYRSFSPRESWWGRSVWRIGWDSKGDHPAVMPLELGRRCILIGTTEGDVVLDPYAGHGSTLLAAQRMDRESLGIELNPDYCRMARNRITDDAPMFNEEAIA